MTQNIKLHPRNIHNKGYDFKSLCQVLPALKPYVHENKYQQLTIDFSEPKAVKLLNSALLARHYNIQGWDIPDGYLCPPIPGRVDYIHYLADLLSKTLSSKSLANQSKQSSKVNVLDIGTGASCIYPILGSKTYQWHFTATDIDPKSIQYAKQNIAKDTTLKQIITPKLQPNAKHIFSGIINESDFFALTLCNPPFHHSLGEAKTGTERKWKNLGKQHTSDTLNFGGQKAELWCPGGEVAFIKNMIRESKLFSQQVLWFTCLVSKKDSLRPIKLALKKANVKNVQVIKMAQGQKISRFIAWNFLDQAEQNNWCKQHLLP